MKKTLKALLCVVLALSMVLSFAACSKDEGANGGQKVEEKDNSKEAEAAVKEVMDAVVDYDRDAIKETLDIECMDVDAYLEDTLDSLGEMAPMYEPAFDTLFGGYFDSYEYEIGEIKKEDDKYTVAVKFSCADLEEANATMNENDFEALGEELAQEKLASGEISEGMSPEEIAVAIMDDTAAILEEAAAEAIESASTKTFDLEFVVVEKDGEWVVDAEASDYDELREEIEGLEE